MDIHCQKYSKGPHGESNSTSDLMIKEDFLETTFEVSFKDRAVAAGHASHEKGRRTYECVTDCCLLLYHFVSSPHLLPPLSWLLILFGCLLCGGPTGSSLSVSATPRARSCWSLSLLIADNRSDVDRGPEEEPNKWTVIDPCWTRLLVSLRAASLYLFVF